MRPVAGRVIPAEFQAMAMGGVGQLAADVAMEGRRGDAVVGAELRGPHREAVVMLGGEDDVFHARALGQPHPGVGVELHRVEALVKVVVDVGRHRFIAAKVVRMADARPTDFLAAEARWSPVDEHPEPRVAPPRQPRVALGLSFGGVQRGRLRQQHCHGAGHQRGSCSSVHGRDSLS